METNPSTKSLMSDELFINLSRWFLDPVNVIVAVVGVVCNTINLLVFSLMKATDTMTLSFMALSISDLLYSCLNLIASIISVLISNGIHVLFKVDLGSLIYIGFEFQRPLFHKISCFITTFVSFERALCVVKPFLVKRLFSKTINLICLVTVSLIFLAFFIPVYLTGRLGWRYTGNTSMPIITAQLSPLRRPAEKVITFVFGFAFMWITEIVIFINAIIMVIGLRRSRKFRESLNPQAASANNQKNSASELSSGKDRVSTKPADQTATKDASSAAAKEDRLVKSVLILAWMHFILNIPLSVFCVFTSTEPEFAPFMAYNNTFFISYAIITFLQGTNAVFNIAVYMNLNTKFRNTFKKCFHKTPREKK